MNLSLTLILFFSSVGQSLFFSKHIFEESACTTLEPRSGDAQEIISPYKIILSENVYHPEIPLSVTIKGNRNSDTFKGFFVEVRRDGKVDPYGSWQSSPNVQLRNCKRNNDAVTHSDLSGRNEIILTWNPPSQNVGNLRVVATVVKDKYSYWPEVTSPVISWFRSEKLTTPFSYYPEQEEYDSQQHSFQGESSNIFEDSCITLKPNVRFEPKITSSPVILTPNTNKYYHNKPIELTLESATPIRSLRGFILQAREYQSSNPKPLGSFTLDHPNSNIIMRSCESLHDTIYQKEPTTFQKIKILWHPPSDFLKRIEFLFTIVQDFENYWHKVPSTTALSFGGKSYRQSSNQPDKLSEDDHDLDEGTCSTPCLKKYPIGTGKGVSDLLVSVKNTVARIEKLLQSRCDGPVDCGDVQDLGFTKSGIYTISPNGLASPQDVFCNLESDDGGWLVVLRYLPEDKLQLDKNWQEFKTGFGDLKKSFRLGNDLLHHITTSGSYELDVQCDLSTGEKRKAHYSLIKIEDESSKYKIHLGAYSGNLGDILKNMNLQVFSTKDRDHTDKHCPSINKIGSWHSPESCYSIKDNILRIIKDSSTTNYVESKIRPKYFKIPISGQAHSSEENPQDCADIQNRGYRKSGVYKIQVTKTTTPIDVYCDLVTDGGGWTILLRKHIGVNSTFNLDRNWNEYKVGFGDPETDYRLGNEYLHQLTAKKSHELRFDTFDGKNNTIKYAAFGHVSVASEALHYKINIQDFSGTDNVIQTFLQINNMAFTTRDRNNLGSSINCAEKYHYGSWYIPQICLPKEVINEMSKLFPRNEHTENLHPERLTQQSNNNQQQQQHGEEFYQQQHSQRSHQQQHSQGSQQQQHNQGFFQQQSQQNFDVLNQKVDKLEKAESFIYTELMTRPSNFKLKLEESKLGGSKKISGAATPKNCAEIQYKGNENNGVYTINLLGSMVQVYCDLESDGGGWVVFKRMYEADTTEFSRKLWPEYQNGFGNNGKNFFLGLDKIHALTQQDASQLRMAVALSPTLKQNATYSHFAVGGSSTLYKLSVSGYSGTLRDVLSRLNGNPFSTKDKDNDGLQENCAENRGFGGWFGPSECKTKSPPLDKLTDATNNFEEDIKQHIKSIEIRIRKVSYTKQQCCSK